MPTLRALECLVAVLEAGSVTEAAARLHLSQPALSHQLAALEREVGGAVVERLPRGVRPTAVGRAVAADARAALAAADRVVATGRSVAGGRAGSVRIACAESLTVPVLAPVLRHWRRRRPDVELSLTELTSADALAEAVEAGEADLALTPRPSTWAGREVVVGTEEVVAVLPTDFPLARGAAVSFEDLAGEPMVHYDTGNGLGRWIDELAARHQVSLTAAVRTRHAATAAQLAAAGLGVALVPVTALGPSLPGALRRLSPAVSRDLVVLTGRAEEVLRDRFVADLERRAVPVPAEIQRKLDA